MSLRSGKACETEKGWVGRMGGGEAMTRVSGKSLNPNDGLRVGRHVFRKKKKKEEREVYHWAPRSTGECGCG